jgi:dephospho-CoA kinase
MITLGLSGSRYSGKDTVAHVFRRIGVPIFEADLILKFILNHNHELLGEVRRELGSDIFINHQLDFRNLRKNTFDKVLDIVQDDLFNAYQKFNDKYERKGAIYTIFNSSILFEREWDRKVDLSISVFAPEGDRLKRARYMTNEGLLNIRDRMKTEMYPLEKNEMADYIINNFNNGDAVVGNIGLQPAKLPNLLKQVNQIDQKVIDEYLYKESLILCV